MAKSKYEKYVSRNAMFPEFFRQEYLIGKETQPPMIFLNGDIPIKGANHFVEVLWVWAPCTVGLDPDKPPHAHDFNEMFIWLGSNPKDPTDLGAEVELWLGEGEERDKVTFDTSTLIFVPKGLVHIPIVYKRVDRPLLHMAIGIDSGQWRIREGA